MVSTDFQDTSDYDPATVVNVMINSAMIGALLLDMLRLVTTKQLKRFNYAMVIATLFLLASMIIDAAQPSIVGYTSFSVPQTSTYLYLISLSLILWMYSERTKAIHSFSHPIHRYLTYGLGPVYLFFRLSVNVMNTMIASAKMQKLKSPVDPNLRQGFRTTMNLFALACALYYEFYTTRKIFKLSKAVKGANAAYNPIRNYSLLYTSLITIVFLIQTALQICRIWYPDAIAPFHNFSWGLMLKRIYDFSDEFQLIGLEDTDPRLQTFTRNGSSGQRSFTGSQIVSSRQPPKYN